MLNSALPPVPSKMALTTAWTPCGCINLSDSNCPHRRLSQGGAWDTALPPPPGHPPREPEDAYSNTQDMSLWSHTNTNTSEKYSER